MGSKAILSPLGKLPCDGEGLGREGSSKKLSRWPWVQGRETLEHWAGAWMSFQGGEARISCVLRPKQNKWLEG